MDLKRIERAIVEILIAIGEDPTREGLKQTPRRIARLYKEIFSGINTDPKKVMKVYRVKNQEEMIIIKDIPFYSMCEHHLLPFFGKAHIVYIPKKNRITGFSNLVQVVETLARRPQIQERLTSQIADLIMARLQPMGLLVVIEAEQLCLSMTGVKKPGHLTVTSAIRGVMRHPATRNEALSLLKKERKD
ncbi:GTP cyclohydrolase I FolE [candidate division WOR-3 bacterium]|uniref:GTP cyclohydrolase 1 n=1 Tax=candidate division WOR-3 bacterium TaxID=2052148 RepID=A0A660SGC8_UNCW3|nr:MAG: GTP cyclohydrolase I FolE [candidate division WOR-3 bacterium]